MAVQAARFFESGRKIIGVGRNYAAHAKELKNEVPTKPFFFLKPTTSYIRPPGPIIIPTGHSVHHEVELGVIISARAKDVRAADAMKYVGGYCLALDMTDRDLQDEAKKKGLPWSFAKGLDTFCAVGDFIPSSKITDPSNVELWLKVDGALKQKSSTSNMIFNIPQLIEYITAHMTLESGDLLLSGTPEGVGPVKGGQVITAGITGITEFKFQVMEKPLANL